MPISFFFTPFEKSYIFICFWSFIPSVVLWGLFFVSPAFIYPFSTSVPLLYLCHGTGYCYRLFHLNHVLRRMSRKSTSQDPIPKTLDMTLWLTVILFFFSYRTIIKYDRVCVMDDGRITEMDTPLALFEKEGGIFRGMCDRSKIRREDFFAVDE
jgi:hypothetical protein